MGGVYRIQTFGIFIKKIIFTRPLSVHADTSAETGKQRTHCKTHCFSLKYVLTINVHDVTRHCMICRFV